MLCGTFTCSAGKKNKAAAGNLVDAELKKLKVVLSEQMRHPDVCCGSVLWRNNKCLRVFCLFFSHRWSLFRRRRRGPPGRPYLPSLLRSGSPSSPSASGVFPVRSCPETQKTPEMIRDIHTSSIPAAISIWTETKCSVPLCLSAPGLPVPPWWLGLSFPPGHQLSDTHKHAHMLLLLSSRAVKKVQLKSEQDLTVTCFISENRMRLGTSTMLSCRNFLRSHSGLENVTAVGRR